MAILMVMVMVMETTKAGSDIVGRGKGGNASMAVVVLQGKNSARPVNVAHTTHLQLQRQESEMKNKSFKERKRHLCPVSRCIV